MVLCSPGERAEFHPPGLFVRHTSAYLIYLSAVSYLMARKIAPAAIQLRALRAESANKDRTIRLLLHREQAREEREQAPADIEGMGGRTSTLVYRDKNMTEFKRVVDDFPNVPFLPSDPDDPDSEPLGFRAGVNHVRTEGLKMLYSLMILPSSSPVLVQGRHRVVMFFYDRAGKMILPHEYRDGQITRADGYGMAVREFFAPSVPYLAGISQETEYQPATVARRDFSG